MKLKKYLGLFILMGMVPPLHATWDVTTPAGSESKSLGDDRIREFKTDIQTSLRYEGDFPGPDTANPRFLYTPSTGTTSQRPSGSTNTAAGMLFVNKSSKTIEQYNGSTWDVIAYTNGFPSGSKLLFFQASCPNGWTQDTSVGGQVLRSTNSTGGGTGGTTDPLATITLTHSHTVDPHTHTVSGTTSSDGAHTHTVSVNVGASNFHTPSTAGDLIMSNTPTAYAAGDQRPALSNTTSGSNGAHTHTYSSTSGSATPGTDLKLTNINLAYANVIVCTAP